MRNQRIGIIGVGGTGSYVLDFVSKTPVREIHLFDGDFFHSHNAFRSPGAASVDSLNRNQKKVGYLSDVYSRMHKYVNPHDLFLTEDNPGLLDNLTFVFICIDRGDNKRLIIDYLLERSIPFIDVGIGISLINGSLTGAARVTTITPTNQNHIDDRIQFNDAGEDEYTQNIQIAEINALNASLAVIKWKKLLGVYHDLGGEHNAIYEINVNKIVNDHSEP